MSIELGSIGASLGSVASGIGRAGGMVGSLSEFKASVPLYSLGAAVKPAGGFLEGFRNMNATDVTTINIGGAPEPGFNPARGTILFQAPIEPAVVEPKVVKTADIIMPKIEPAAMPLPAPAPKILEYAQPQPQLQTKTENRVSAAVAPAAQPRTETQPVIQTQPKLQPKEQEVEEIVEEKVKKQEPKERLEEEEVKESTTIVEDGEVTAQRTLDIKVVAVRKAQELAIKLGLKKIPGRFIALFAPKEYAGVRSQITKKQGPDGSYEETVEELAGAGEFDSVTAAQEKVGQVIAEKKPGKYGKNGLRLTFGHIARILKYRILRSLPAHTEAVTRVIKKKVPVSQTENPAPAAETEPKLHELSPALADVFQKAA